MNRLFIPFAILTSLVSGHGLANDNWPQFRGPSGSGIGSGSPPTSWNIKTGENVEWKAPIPGLGHASPVVWGNRVFIATAVNSETEQPSLKTGWVGGAGESASDSGDWTWQLICLELDSGKLLWTRDVQTGEPAIKRHLKATHANCTPATDGVHVVAFFGSEGLHSFDFDGKLLWKKDFGRLHSGPHDAKELEWGFASSPVIHKGMVVVQCDCLNTNFVALLDVKTGAEVRRIDREGEVATWSTPCVVTTDDRTQIVCNGYHQMAGYDFETSTRLWHLSNGGDVPVPTPLFANNLIYLTNAHGGSHTFAVHPSATGDITPVKDEELKAGLAWWQPKDGSYMPTPLVKGGLLYTCNDNGRLAVRNALDGKLVYRERVGTGTRTFSASAVAAGGHLYFASERGEVSVIREGRTFESVAQNEMQEIVMATPAVSGERLLIRTARNLFCISSKPVQK